MSFALEFSLDILVEERKPNCVKILRVRNVDKKFKLDQEYQWSTWLCHIADWCGA